MRPVLSVRDLTIALSDGTPVTAALSFDIMPGEILGLVGESGCGKSVTALSLMGLLSNEMHVAAGSALFDPAAAALQTADGAASGSAAAADGSASGSAADPDGAPACDLYAMTEKERCRVNGSSIAMIYQEPMTALNPLLTIGDQIGEVLRIHTSMKKNEIREKVLDILRRVDFDDPEKKAASYPHQLSGGQRQRVCIAMAAISRPALLIADEPTTALDVMTQDEILALIRRLNRKYNTAVLFISHDLSVIEKICSRVMIMYAGSAAECGPAAEVLARPAHPYTIGLLHSIPDPGRKGSPLICIPGRVPSVHDVKFPCPFADRCGVAKIICRMRRPPRADFSDGHYVFCHFANERQRTRWNSTQTTSSK